MAQIGFTLSRIAVTLATGRADGDQPADRLPSGRLRLRQLLRQLSDDPPACRRETGCPAARDDPLTLSLDRSIGPKRCIEGRAAPCDHSSDSQACRCASTTDANASHGSVEVEVLQRQTVAGQ